MTVMLQIRLTLYAVTQLFRKARHYESRYGNLGHWRLQAVDKKQSISIQRPAAAVAQLTLWSSVIGAHPPVCRDGVVHGSFSAGDGQTIGWLTDTLYYWLRQQTMVSETAFYSGCLERSVSRRAFNQCIRHVGVTRIRKMCIERSDQFRQTKAPRSILDHTKQFPEHRRLLSPL